MTALARPDLSQKENVLYNTYWDNMQEARTIVISSAQFPFTQRQGLERIRENLFLQLLIAQLIRGLTCLTWAHSVRILWMTKLNSINQPLWQAATNLHKFPPTSIELAFTLNLQILAAALSNKTLWICFSPQRQPPFFTISLEIFNMEMGVRSVSCEISF